MTFVFASPWPLLLGSAAMIVVGFVAASGWPWRHGR